MRWILIWMVMAMVVGAPRAGAQTLELSLDGDSGYDSNVFNGENARKSGVFTLSAHGAVSDDLERFAYRVSYAPRYHAYTNPNANNAFNHLVDLKGTYRFTPRTELKMSNSFAHTERIRQLEASPADPADPGDPNVNPQGERTLTRNKVDMSVRHLLTSRLTSNFYGEYTIYEYSDLRQEDSSYLAGNASMNYSLTKTTSVGGGGGFGLRAFDPSPFEPPPPPRVGEPAGADCSGESQPGSRSVNAQGYVSVTHAFDETTRVSVQAGPAYIDSNTFFCGFEDPVAGTNPLTMKSESSRVTWFAQVAADKRWKKLSGSTSYRRSEGVAGSGTGGAINDRVDAQIRWTIDQRWSARASGGWLQRVSTGGANAQSQDLETWRANVQLSRQMSQRSTVTLSASYVNQSTTGNVPFADSQTTSYQAYRVNLGFTYRFEPWRY